MDQLERECRSYTRYLTGRAPVEYLIDKYRDFHVRTGDPTSLNPDPFDRFLVEVSARGPYWARLADTYASRFRKDSAVRQKLVVTLALLECTPPTFELLDTPDRGGTGVAILRLGFQAALFAVHLLVGAVLFTPARVRWAGTGRTDRGGIGEQ